MRIRSVAGVAALAVVHMLLAGPALANPARRAGQPNIIVIMGDDIGWFNIGAYHQGIMAGRTPNLDRLAAEGMRFTDYYAEASCTAARANFITGQLPIRTGLTTVGQITSATSTSSCRRVHGFDEFFGWALWTDRSPRAAARPFDRSSTFKPVRHESMTVENEC